MWSPLVLITWCRSRRISTASRGGYVRISCRRKEIARLPIVVSHPPFTMPEVNDPACFLLLIATVWHVARASRKQKASLIRQKRTRKERERERRDDRFLLFFYPMPFCLLLLSPLSFFLSRIPRLLTRVWYQLRTDKTRCNWITPLLRKDEEEEEEVGNPLLLQDHN